MILFNIIFFLLYFYLIYLFKFIVLKGTLGFMSMYSLNSLESDMQNFRKLVENH
jgi:hypothetical protein